MIAHRAAPKNSVPRTAVSSIGQSNLKSTVRNLCSAAQEYSPSGNRTHPLAAMSSVPTFPTPEDPWGERSSDRPARHRLSPTDVAALPDFSASLALNPEYRRGYSQWRSGNARGARGEPKSRSTLPVNQSTSSLPINQPTPNDPWAEISPVPTRRGTPTGDWVPAPLRLNHGAHPSPDDPWAENQSPPRRKPPPVLQRVSAHTVRAMPDFSLSMAPDYRQGYSNWRAGNARGAQGEPKSSPLRPGAFPMAVQHVQHVSESDPWAERE